ncbi:MAG: hypothetical protein HYT16_03495 [DPANN group archaeon]|nr:hypothetical protein [DPANN group archaeon]
MTVSEMKLEQTQDFLDLCEKLKRTNASISTEEIISNICSTLDISAAQHKTLSLHKRKLTKEQLRARLFENLMGTALSGIADDYGARQLQESDAGLFAPFNFTINGFGCKLYGTNTRNVRVDATDFDAVLVSRDAIFIFEAKSGKKINPNEYNLVHLSRMLSVGTKVAYGLVVTQDMYKKLNSPNYSLVKQSVTGTGTVITYLPVLTHNLEDAVENFLTRVSAK